MLRLARAGAQFSVRHGDSRPLHWAYPFVVRTLRYGRQSSLRRLFPWLASLSFAADRSGPSAAPLAPVSPEQALKEARRAVEHRAALASLLAYEIRHVRGGQVERATEVDVHPDELVRDGVVVPTEPMLSRLAGRVQPRWIATSNDTGLLAPDPRPTVTAAVRFHDIDGLPDLERSLHCLAAQRGVDLDVLVVYQGWDAEDILRIERAVEEAWLGPKRPRVLSVPNPEGGDRRAALLNSALRVHYEETGNDFFYVLDHDDLIFSHALATLAGPLVGSDVAIAFGKVLVARYLSLHEYEFLFRMDDFFRSQERDLAELMVDNFFPIHAYVFHTRAMPPGWLRFQEAMDRLEDYECLLRVVAEFPAAVGAIDELIGLYCWHGSRALHGPIEGIGSAETGVWERNRRLLARTMIEVASHTARQQSR